MRVVVVRVEKGSGAAGRLVVVLKVTPPEAFEWILRDALQELAGAGSGAATVVPDISIHPVLFNLGALPCP